MSKLITLSNLGYFLSKLTVPEYIKNIPTSPVGNIYLDTTNTLLKYKKGGEWYEIALYEEKPTENTIALRIGNKTYYAGLVDPADEEASDLRIRLKNVVYAVAKEKPTETGILSNGKYVKTPGTFSLGGSEDVELMANLRVNLVDPTNNKYYSGSNQDAPPYLRIYEAGGTVEQSPTYREANKQGYEWKRAKSGLAYVETHNNSVLSRFTYPSSFTATDVTFANSETVLGIDIEYKMEYTASDFTVTWYVNSEQLYVYDQYNKTKTYNVCQENFKSVWGVTKNFQVAIGDITNNGNIQVTLNDFYVKVSGEQVLGVSDLK